MYKKIAIAGGTVALIVGIGTAAMAETTTSSSSTAPSASASSTAGAPAKAGGVFSGKADRRIVHGQVVTRGKDGTFVTHDVANGQVTAVSATSIAVKTADNSTLTFVVNSSTKVRVRTNGKGAAGTISQVAVGDNAVVLGTGASTATATHIVDVKK